MSNNLKYLHVVNKITQPMKTALNEEPRRGGMYNWMFAFNGKMMPYNLVEQKDLDEADVIQVNMAPSDQLLIHDLHKRLKNSSTLLIANNDYVTEAWDSWNQHPKQYTQVQELPDAVFGTEKHQTSHLREDAYCIPHPHWIKMLKHIGNDDLWDGERTKIGALYHWWEGRTYHQYNVLERLREKYPKINTRLYGYINRGDKMATWQRLMFDETMPNMEYPNFIRSMMTNKFIVENCSYHTYGRTSVDTAALQIPTMGTDRVFSMKHCWPNMVADPFDGKKQLEIMDKIMSDEDWVKEQVDYAYKACDYFNYDNSKKRYMKMVEETRDRCKK